MLMTATSELVKIMGNWARRADAVLVTGAARNAASSIHDHQARRLDDARTMSDLRRVETRTRQVDANRRR